MEHLTYEEWLFINENELLIKFAETGADREMDFDLEAEFRKEYENRTVVSNTTQLYFLCKCTPACEWLPAYECDYCKDICENLER
jgi:hypothetical protein